jgi:hypothetical protein
MKNGSVFVLAMSILVAGHVCASAQEPIPVTKNYVAWAHEFLRTMYPNLNGGKGDGGKGVRRKRCQVPFILGNDAVECRHGQSPAS